MKKNIINSWTDLLIFFNIFQHDLYRDFASSFSLRSDSEDRGGS